MKFRKQHKKHIQRWYHLRALIVGIFFASLAYYVIHQYDLLTADILWWVEQIMYGESDTVAYIAWDGIALDAWRSLGELESVSVLIFYDPETLALDDESFSSEYAFVTASAGEHMMQVVLTDLWEINIRDRLLYIQWQGDNTAISFGDIIGIFRDSSSEPLSLMVPR